MPWFWSQSKKLHSPFNCPNRFSFIIWGSFGSPPIFCTKSFTSWFFNALVFCKLISSWMIQRPSSCIFYILSLSSIWWATSIAFCSLIFFVRNSRCCTCRSVLTPCFCGSSVNCYNFSSLSESISERFLSFASSSSSSSSISFNLFNRICLRDSIIWKSKNGNLT